MISAQTSGKRAPSILKLISYHIGFISGLLFRLIANTVTVLYKKVFNSAQEKKVLREKENLIIGKAIHILEKRMYERGPMLDNPKDVEAFLKVKLSGEENEVFAVIFMDTQNQIICFEILFKGTVNSATIHTRILIKRALQLNAAKIICAHNHPSGNNKPSKTDNMLTQHIKSVLSEIDVELLDHFIIGKGKAFSYANNRML